MVLGFIKYSRDFEDLLVVDNIVDNIIEGPIDLFAVWLDLIGWQHKTVPSFISQLKSVAQRLNRVKQFYSHAVGGNYF